MPNINPPFIADGDDVTEDALNAPGLALVALVNGFLDDENFAAAGLDVPRLARGQAFTSDTPTWTASGNAIGNGSHSQVYEKIGRNVKVHGALTFGSTTNGGTGAWSISLPFPAANTGNIGAIGSWVAEDTSLATYAGVVLVGQGGATVMSFVLAAGGFVTATTPFTFANGDILHYSIEYISAT